MTIDFSRFCSNNVADTCSIWNLLSSHLLFARARSVGCSFSCTQFVYYECLHKPRSESRKEDQELQQRFREVCKREWLVARQIDIVDLQDVMLLERRQSLSKGELSSIAFAKGIGQAFMTDDQRARKLAREVMAPAFVQTTPHLLGWLIFHNHLSDGDKDQVIAEHKACGRPLARHFENAYCTALQYRLTQQAGRLNVPMS